MDRSSKRRRGRRKVEYIDVVPSSDLPPLVEGELRCLLFITVGEIVWGTTAPARPAPVSPAYIRLRWWGEASDGTFFRPQTTRDDRPTRTRAQFGIRSGPKQMAAYFHDMGSVTFDILASPKGLPIGRVQVPGIASLSASNPIRGFFPIISSSSRRMGELHISLSFKPVRGAYDDSDTGTDGSVSARSRTASIGGRGSRRSSWSRNSSRASSRSRSNSTGSRGRRSRSNSGEGRRTNQPPQRRVRSRSRSNDSKNSSNSHRSRSGKTGGSPVTTSTPVVQFKSDNPTPRGIDAMLEQNGYDLYGTNDNAGFAQIKSIKTTVSSTKPPMQQPPTDAMAELLNRGKQLRDEMTRCALSSDTMFARPLSVARHQVEEVQPISRPINISDPIPNIQLPKQQQKPTTPKIHERSCNTDMRIVDMVLGAKGLQNDISMASDMSSCGSTRLSMVSELEDPLHDVSILNHLFYNNVSYPIGHTISQNKGTIQQPKPVTEMRKEEPTVVTAVHKPTSHHSTITGQSVEKLTALGHVHLARVAVKSLQVNFDLNSEDEGVKGHPTKKQKEKAKSKPPVPAKQKKAGTFFIEYKFPQDSHRSSTTAHEVTRVASRKVSPGGLVKFDQHSVFPIRFNTTTVARWRNDSLQFQLFHRRPKDKKALLVGIATFPLNAVLNNSKLSFNGSVNIMDPHDNTSSVVGSVKISIELTSDSKDLPRQMSSAKQPASVTTPKPYTVSKCMTSEAEMDTVPFSPNKRGIPREVVPVTRCLGQKVCIAEDIETSYKADGRSPSIELTSTILHLYISLKEARDIPATRLQCGAGAGPNIDPNVYLVCRTFASDEPSKTGVVWNTSNPKFDFNLVTPVKISSELFTRLKDNFIVVEVWTKIPTDTSHNDKLMGLAKIPLHLFYQSLKDEEIARAVLTSHHPLVSMDGFTPIVDVFTGHGRGKLKVLLALGTQEQICALRKTKEQESSNLLPPDPHHLDDTTDTEDGGNNIPYLQHSFDVSVVGIRGFKPLDNQVWGETDCFVQYSFPTQCRNPVDGEDNSSDDEEHQELARMKSYRTDATLCVPDPQFHHTRAHLFHPPPSVPVQRILLSACSGVGKYTGGGIPFEVWSRYYYPNVRDQLLASGSLPVAKLCALITMHHDKLSQQTFQVPMVFTDPETPGSTQSAGNLQVSVKYKSSAHKSQPSRPQIDFNRSIKLEIAVLRAAGLQRAARLVASFLSDTDLNYCGEVGVNTYVMLKPGFLKNETIRKTHCVPRSFAPDYHHHFELSCPLVAYHDSESPVSLASSLAAGQLELEIWHRPSPEDSSDAGDILLGRTKIATQDLLTRTTGLNGWYPITSLDPANRNASVNVGAIELSAAFTSRQDLELALRAAKSVSWQPPSISDLSRMLVPDSLGVLRPLDQLSITHNVITACVTITNAWFPKQLVVTADGEMNRKAHVYARYKFYDKDSVTSSLCPAAANAVDANTAMAKLAHRRSFLCKPSQPFVWYLREEALQLQVWLTFSHSGKSHHRPLDRDVLLGTAEIDLSSMLISGLQRQQHISGLYSLYKPGVDDLGNASVRVYVSLNPGDHSKPCDFEITEDECSESILSTTESSDSKSEIVVEENPTGPNIKSFSAVVSVERAMHLPQFSPNVGESNPRRFVSYQVQRGDKEVTSVSRAVTSSPCPVWNDTQEVLLDRKLLLPEGGSVLFRVWHRESGSTEDAVVMATDRMIGFATVDISILSSGFGAVNGWYNILDIHANCQGQLKVAITPTEPVTSYKSINKPQMQTPFSSSILHSVPLSIPIQTPSGSLYYPGVPSSGQTVGSTCKTSENPLQTVSPTQPYENMNNTSSISTLPPRTMFMHGKQQACLLGTLQKQMKELEQIKQNFSKRAPKPLFELQQPEVTPFHQQITTSTTLSTAATTSTHTSTTQSISSDCSSTIQNKPTHNPTVHLSLFKPGNKNSDDFDDDMALSDNEYSDVEIVCPRNLNQQSVIDLPPIGEARQVADAANQDDEDFIGRRSENEQFLGTNDENEKFLERNDDNEEFLGTNDENMKFMETNRDFTQTRGFSAPEINQNEDFLPQRSQEDDVDCSSRKSHSAEDLDNTSLWLSRSASRIEDEDQLNGSYSQNPDKELVLRVHKDDVIPINPIIQAEDFKEDLLDDLSITSQPLAEDNVEQDFSVEIDGNIVDNNVDVVMEDEPESSFIVDQEEDVPSSSKEQPLDDIDENNHVKEHNSSSTSSKKSILEIEDAGTDVGIHSPPSQSHEVLSPQRDTPPILNLEDEEESSNASSDEDQCPQPSAGKTSALKQLPSFFPPSLDLIRSMRALQAITTEQKHNLMKQQSIPTNDDEGRTPPPSKETSPTSRITRRKLVKPPSFTNEQTKRLAKIFNSKFASG